MNRIVALHFYFKIRLTFQYCFFKDKAWFESVVGESKFITSDIFIDATEYAKAARYFQGH